MAKLIGSDLNAKVRKLIDLAVMAVRANNETTSILRGEIQSLRDSLRVVEPPNDIRHLPIHYPDTDTIYPPSYGKNIRSGEAPRTSEISLAASSEVREPYCTLGDVLLGEAPREEEISLLTETMSSAHTDIHPPRLPSTSTEPTRVTHADLDAPPPPPLPQEGTPSVLDPRRSRVVA